MRRFLLLLAVVAGCAGAARLSRADFAETTWFEVCPDPEIASAFVRLLDDGHVAWSYAHPDSVRRDTVHTWAVRDDTLFVQWANGTAGTPYTATADAEVLAGPATFCPEGATLQRLR